MSTEETKELCKAFAYRLSINKISKVTGVKKNELESFYKDNEAKIGEIKDHYNELTIEYKG